MGILRGNAPKQLVAGADPGGPLTTKNEAPAPKFYKIEASEWQF